MIYALNAKAQGELELNMNRTFGMAFGKNIQGTFTIKGTGSTNITYLWITFNGTEVANSTGNTISFKFKTNDYESGEVNITLWGSGGQLLVYSTSKIFNFMSPAISTTIAVSVIILVLGALVYKYGPRIRAKLFPKTNKIESGEIKQKINHVINK